MSLSTTTLRRGRRVAAASLVAAAALSLTACRHGDDKASAVPSASSGQDASGGSTAESAASGGPSAGGQAGGDSATGTDKGAPGRGTAGGQGAATGGSAGQGDAPAGLKGVSGSWVGKLKWLTEDKLSVAPDYGPEQAFYIAGSTRALGAAALCEAPDGRVHTDGPGYGTTACTLGDLRKAARMGTVDVRVTVQGGVAAKIAERYHP
ncbi:hypothetical protein [Streptomyces angustmyceticus]|uniref:hypothetical protein n=1 Tax=Streptomyces angustmyceticus TaxID=285578 RepID=UPI00344ECC83